MKNSTYILALAGIALGAAPVAAAPITIVSYGPGNYVSTDRALSVGGYDSVTDSFNTISPATLYSGPEFSGVLWQAGDNTEIENQPNGDRIQIKNINWGLILFEQDGFLNGASTAMVSFDGDSQIVLNVITDAAHENHLVIRAAGAYYISGDIITTSAETFAPTAVTWYAYDPTIDPTAFNATGTGVSLVSGGLVSDIEAVGVYSRNTTTNNGVEALDFDTFTVTAVVPEPAGLCLIGLAGIGLLRRRSRG